jgi:hypothetical protein
MVHNPEIGRVLRASTTGFAVGSRVNQLTEPGFGSLVKVVPSGREVIYGLIYDIHIDDDQLIQRLVMTESPRPEIIEDQRQNRMLPVEMSILTVGYGRGEHIQHGLPPRPPLNLDPVQLCTDPEEMRRFSQPNAQGIISYLRLILRAPVQGVAVDQLVVAHVLDVYERRGRDHEWAMSAAQELIELLRSNYDLLIPTLEALSAALPELGVL